MSKVRWNAIVRAVTGVAMLYVLIAGAAGIALKVHYPPYNICKIASYGSFDAYCTTVDEITAPAMGLLEPLAFVVMYFQAALVQPGFRWNDFGFVPAIALFGIPLIAITLIFSLAWYPRSRFVALVVPMLVAAEVIWDGVTYVYGIT